MESRMKRNFHVRFGVGENLKITSKDYLSLQQLLTKKNTYSNHINKRNLKTGQVTGDDRIARISDSESFCLLSYKNDNYALKEFLGPRADSIDGKSVMQKEISKQGYVSMKDLPSDITQKQTLNTVNTLLLASGIENDLMSERKEDILNKLKSYEKVL